MSNPTILPYWDDLIGGGIYTGTATIDGNNTFIVEFRDKNHYCCYGDYSFEIQLEEGTNNIYLLYGAALTDNGSSATIGIKVSPSDYLQWSFNESKSGFEYSG